MPNSRETSPARCQSPFSGSRVYSFSCNNAPNELGAELGKFHELETLSPTRELKTGETLTHKNRTLHLKADMKTLNKLAKTVPGVDLKTVRPAMMSKKK